MADWGAIIATGLGTASIGTTIVLIKTVVAPIIQTTKELAVAVKDLYEAKNCHESRIVKIETVHEVKGCVK